MIEYGQGLAHAGIEPRNNKPGRIPNAVASNWKADRGMVLEDTGRELIESCQRGERDSFRTLFEAHKDKVYSIALRYSGDEAEAMDIAQETFLKLFSCIRDFRGEASFESWLYRLVVNSCLDRKRRGRRLLPLVDGLLVRATGKGVLQR